MVARRRVVVVARMIVGRRMVLVARMRIRRRMVLVRVVAVGDVGHRRTLVGSRCVSGASGVRDDGAVVVVLVAGRSIAALVVLGRGFRVRLLVARLRVVGGVVRLAVVRLAVVRLAVVRLRVGSVVGLG